MARSQPVKEHRTLKDRARGMFRTEFTCCGRTMHGNLAQKAHQASYHSGMWASKKARAAARSMGKEWDKARRHAMGWLRAAGLRDERGRPTARAKSRPEIRGHVKARDLHKADRHHRDHERADKHDRRAERHAARGNTTRQVDHHQRAANLRNAWPERPPTPQRTR